MAQIILASSSPRRKEILEQIGLSFLVECSDTEENVMESNPERLVQKLAQKKALAVAGRKAYDKEWIVIGADTVVACNGAVLGKPANKEEARVMIQQIQGRTHEVYTGVSFAKVCAGIVTKQNTFAERTSVQIAAMNQTEIEQYISGTEPYDKAGGYGIQGEFAKFVEGIKGDYYNVMGLPAARIYQELKEFY